MSFHLPVPDLYPLYFKCNYEQSAFQSSEQIIRPEASVSWEIPEFVATESEVGVESSLMSDI